MKSIQYIIFLFVFQTTSFAQPELLEGFSHEWLDLDFENPVGMTFDEYNRMMIWEKGGKVWYVNDGIKAEEPLLDISDEVGNYGDMGMLGFALDPNFKTNGFIYVMYVVDYHHLMFAGTSLYDPGANLYNRATIMRCTRYTVNNMETDPQVDYNSRKILLGEGPGTGPSVMYLSHVGCAIEFGEDGTLLIATGDGSGWEGPYYGDGPPYLSNYVEQGLEDGIISEEQDVGALRPQQKGSLNGKILRIDPSSGEGISSNPYFDPSSPNSIESKIWSLGLRNPFKILVRPGSGFSDPALGLPGVIYIGDVGNGLWEEINISRKGGENFGWPLYEGCDEHVVFPTDKINRYAANPLYQINGCETEFFTFEDLLKQESKNDVVFKNPCDDQVDIPEDLSFVHSRPALNLAHSTAGYGLYFGGYDEEGNAVNLPIDDPSSNIEGDFSDLRARCIIGGDFYTANTFPEEYSDKYFFADYNLGWINYLEYDLNDSITAIKPFFTDTFPITDLSVNPNDGCLYVINYDAGFSRICYGENLPPRAIIESDKTFGVSPLSVNFKADSSFDPQGETIDVEWDFGDGIISNEWNPDHIFNENSGQPRVFRTSLKITDEVGQSTTTTKLISVNNTPPQVSITSIENGQLYNMTGISEIILEADVVDDEHQDNELTYNWVWSLHHNTHNHPEPAIKEESGLIQLLPTGCDGEVYYYGVELSVEDSHGLIGTDEVFLYPDCGSNYLELLTFRAQLVDEHALCSWSTREEENVDHFEVERSRTGLDFIYLGTVSANNGVGEQVYDFVDNKLLPGINIYRIKMVSAEGIATYSDERIVLFAEPNEIFVYPNPAVNELQVFYGKLNDQAQIEIFNLEGKLIRRFEMEGTGTQIQKIDLRGINPGNYFYRIKNGEVLKTGRFIIAN